MNFKAKIKKPILFVMITLSCLGLLITYYLYPLYQEVSITSNSLPHLSQTSRGLTSIILDRQQRKIADLAGEKKYLMETGEISADVREAFVSAEDKYFFHHQGVNPVAMLRAVWVNAFEGGWAQGASTITQQLVRILFLSQEKTLPRKLKEIFLALAMEKHFTKEQILTLYLNNIYFGHQAYGLAAAAARYFDKAPRDLSLAEAALLAGIIKAPSYYAPHKHPTRARQRQLFVLEQMLANHYITAAEFQQAKQSAPLIRTPQAGAQNQLGFLRDIIRKELTRRFEIEEAHQQGLKIHTSFDAALQQAAAQAIQAHLPRDHSRHHKRLEAALISLDSRSGAILTLQGSLSYPESQYNRAFYMRRPLGQGLLLPLVTAVALEEGFHPLSTLSLPPASPWAPPATLSLYDALLQGSNAATLALMGELGSANINAFARQLGLHWQASLDPKFPDRASGSPLEVAVAYSAFFNRGKSTEPYSITGIAGFDGKALYEKPLSRQTPVCREETAFIMQELLQHIPLYSSQARGLPAGLPRLAGTMSTSDDLQNAWFVGSSGSLLHVLWVGAEFGGRKVAATREQTWALLGRILGDYLEGARSVVASSPGFSPPPAGKVSFGRFAVAPPSSTPSSSTTEKRPTVAGKARTLPFAIGREPSAAQPVRF